MRWLWLGILLFLLVEAISLFAVIHQPCYDPETGNAAACQQVRGEGCWGTRWEEVRCYA
jgi:hypothetical protein